MASSVQLKVKLETLLNSNSIISNFPVLQIHTHFSWICICFFSHLLQCISNLAISDSQYLEMISVFFCLKSTHLFNTPVLEFIKFEMNMMPSLIRILQNTTILGFSFFCFILYYDKFVLFQPLVNKGVVFFRYLHLYNSSTCTPM